ncbi:MULTISPECIES: replication initiation protein [Paenibacillus]|uniref:Replication initiation protein n=1 Tax=Paenibacillus artemisiicola TaxID=1172618 RepID=A0ABS3WCC4_9BACL|nr:replication initiation protein [Paenibacillus artemisiicola]MBO7745781.1 replication initiation protein [Paenibacillus artemisiicola]
MVEQVTDQEELDVEPDGQLALTMPESVEANIKDYYWVNQSREIINAQQDLDLTERRLIFSLVSLVQPDDEEFKTYTVSIKDLANLIGVEGKSFYERVERAIDQLQSKQLKLSHENTRQKITWVQSATYKDGEGRVTIKLSEDLAPFFRNLKRAYTKFRLKNVLKLKSEYNWRLYELLKEREFRKERIFKVKELRHLLNIPDDKYKMLKHLRELIDRAKVELEEKTDISFTYDIHKRVGRSVESFIFRINKNTNNQHSDQEEINYDAENLLQMLLENGIHRKKAVQLAKAYHPFYIEENIRHVRSMNAGQSIRNMAGYIVKALEENYANSLYDTPIDDPMFGLELRNVEQGLEEASNTDIEVFNAIVANFKGMLHRLSDPTPERLKEIAEERDRMLIEALSTVQKKRKAQRKPPLLYDDIAGDPYMKAIYEKWENSSLPF